MIDTVEVVPGLTIEADVTRDVFLSDLETSMRLRIKEAEYERRLAEDARDKAYFMSSR